MIVYGSPYSWHRVTTLIKINSQNTNFLLIFVIEEPPIGYPVSIYRNYNIKISQTSSEFIYALLKQKFIPSSSSLPNPLDCHGKHLTDAFNAGVTWFTHLQSEYKTILSKLDKLFDLQHSTKHIKKSSETYFYFALSPVIISSQGQSLLSKCAFTHVTLVIARYR